MITKFKEMYYFCYGRKRPLMCTLLMGLSVVGQRRSKYLIKYKSVVEQRVKMEPSSHAADLLTPKAPLGSNGHAGPTRALFYGLCFSPLGLSEGPDGRQKTFSSLYVPVILPFLTPLSLNPPSKPHLRAQRACLGPSPRLPT